MFNEYTFRLCGFLGSIGVQLFFCITGLLFANKLLAVDQVNWTTFYQKRMLRIIPAYFAASLLALLIAGCCLTPDLPRLDKIITTLPGLFSFGLMPLPNFPGFDFNRLLVVNWTLAFEWRFYVLLPFIFILIKKSNFAFSALIIVAIGDVALTHKSFWVFFVSGATYGSLMQTKVDLQKRIIGYIGIIFVLFVYLIYWHKCKNYGLNRFFLMSILFGSLVAVKPQVLTSRLLVAMGSISYSFYLLHTMVLFAVVKFIHVYLIDVTSIGVLPFTVIVGFTLALAVCLSTLSYLYVELPFIGLSGKKRIINPQMHHAVINAAV